MSLLPGTRLGPYEVRSALGAGGMGEVYRARDTKLQRDIALKVLPASVADDPDRLARFEREAQVLAALNHPHIGAIYGLEEAVVEAGLQRKSVVALVLELVEGPTLADRIAHGPIPPDEAIPIARQIAEALEAAHEAGIIHRDLKPANIKLRPDGTVKVLDFGLAKAFDPASGSGTQATGMSHSPTLTARGTEAGIILGTAAYMAPEQARGKPVDKRADIWAFGVVLFEMLTGHRLFEGETISDTLAAVLTRDVNWSLVPTATPPAIRQLLCRCLDRDATRRLRDIGEARVLLGDSAALAPTARHDRPAQGRLSWLVAAAAAALAAAAGFLMGRGTAPPVAASLATTFAQLTDRPGIERQPTISPDGRTVVFVSDERGNDDLYLLRVGGRNVVALTADSDAADTAPAFSPDGARIAFRSERAGGGIFVMDATGESVRRVTDAGYDPRWSPDGTALVVADEPVIDPMSRHIESALWVVKLADGARRKVADADAVGGRWSPSGRRIVYWGRQRFAQRDIRTVASDGSQASSPVPVTEDAAVDWSPVWSPDGRYVYFASNRGGTMNLWRTPVDESSGQVLGPPQSVTTPAAWAGGFEFAADGRKLVFAEQDERATIWSAALDPVKAVVHGTPRMVIEGRAINSLDLSPDGTRVAFSQRGNPWEAIGVIGSDGTGWSRVTDDAQFHRLPTWSPDGSRIAFYGGLGSLWTIDADGSAPVEIAPPLNERALFYPVWSPDGRRLVASGTGQLLVLDPSTKPATVVHRSPARPGADTMVPFSWSPDGRWIAGASRSKSGINDRVQIVDAGLTTVRELPGPGRSPAWLPDSRRLIVAQSRRLLVVDSDSHLERALLPVAQPDLVWGRTVSLSRDGRTLVYLESRAEGDVWLMSIE